MSIIPSIGLILGRLLLMCGQLMPDQRMHDPLQWIAQTVAIVQIVLDGTVGQTGQEMSVVIGQLTDHDGMIGCVLTVPPGTGQPKIVLVEEDKPYPST